jgi:hypothetical protein
MAIAKRLHQIGLAALLFLGFLCQAQAAVVGWGGRDVTFTPPALNGPVNAIIQLKVGSNAGKYLIGGSFTNAGGNANIDYVARLNADGTIDTTFQGPTTYSNGRTSGCFNGDGTSAPAIDVRALLETQISSNNNDAGDITIGGNFTNVGGNAAMDYLFRVGANGAVDTNFYPTDTGGSGGTPTYTHCVNMMFTAEGTGTGLRLIVGNNAEPRVSKKVFDTGANAGGYTEPAFAPSPVTTGFYCTAAMGCPGNRYVIGGAFGDVNGDTKLARMVRLNTNGSVDATAYPTSDGTASGTVLFNGRVNSIALDSTNSAILVGGRFAGKLAKVALSDFAPDPDYEAPVSGTGSTLNGDVWSVAVAPTDPDDPSSGDPSYVFTGGFTNAGNKPQCDYVCNSDSSGNVGWYFPAPPPTAVVRVVTVNDYADTNVGKYMIGGDFTDLGGNTATDYVARLNQATAASITINSSGGNNAGGTDGIRTVYSNGQWQVYREGTGQLYEPETDPADRFMFNQVALALTDGSGGGYIIGPSTLHLNNQYWNTSNRVFRPWDSVTATGGSTGTGTGASDLSVQVDGRTYLVHLDLDYTYPNDYIRQTFTVTVPAGNTYNVKLYNLYDSYLGGSDTGPGFYNQTAKIVGVSGQTVYEGLRYVSGQDWAGYMSAQYLDVVFSNTTLSATHVGPGTGTNLDNSIITDPNNDNGFGVNWDFGSAAGATTVADDFIFSDFVAPTAAATANPGEIKVDWTDPAGISPAPDSYVVTAYDDNGNQTAFTCTATAPTKTCTVTGLNPAIFYTFLVDFRSGGSSVFNAGSNDAQPLPYQLTGTLWRDNGAGGGGKENGLKAGAEILLNLPGTVGGEAGYVVILDNTNTVVAIATVCVNPTTFCELGQLPGDWKATTIEAEPNFIAYVTNGANKPNLGDVIAISPSPAVAPTGFGFTIPNANNSASEIQGTPPNGILTGINPTTALFSLNFGVVSNSCAIP